MKRARFDADLDAYCQSKGLRWQDVARQCIFNNHYEPLALVICDYILHRTQQAQGHAGVGKPIIATVLEWAELFLWACIQEFKLARDELRKLIAGPSTDSNVMYKIHNFIRTLAIKYNLPRKTDRERLFWGPMEATIMLKKLESNKFSFNFEAGLQTMNMIKVLMTIGARPGSLGRSQVENPDCCALPLSCVTIFQKERLKYTIKLDLVSLKGFNDVLADASSQPFQIRQVQRKQDLLLDLSSTLIPALVARRVVFDVMNGVMINNIEEFLSSSSTEFNLTSSKEENLFLQGKQGHGGITSSPITAKGCYQLHRTNREAMPVCVARDMYARRVE